MKQFELQGKLTQINWVSVMLSLFSKSVLKLSCFAGSTFAAVVAFFFFAGELSSTKQSVEAVRRPVALAGRPGNDAASVEGNEETRDGRVRGDHVRRDYERFAAAAESRVSVLLTHGLGDEALRLLNEMVDVEGGGRWSSGRLCWYKSLACRLSGDQKNAVRWSREAERLGIPELGDETFAFWEQQHHWSDDLLLDFAETPQAIGGTRYVSLLAEADSVAYTAKRMVGEIQAERRKQNEDNGKPEQILSEVRLATWELLLGEYTSFHESLALWTTSVNSFVEGKQLLQKIEADIELNPDLEQIVSSDPAVAIRLDSARVRLVAIENKEALSRQEEVDRLHQLREIAKQYRSMVDSMLSWQAYFSLNDLGKSGEKAGESVQFLRDVQSTVDERSADFHLFDDEPAVDSESEFSILNIKPSALSNEPVAKMKALQGYSLWRAAIGETNEGDPSMELIDDAERWAKASLDDAENIAGVPVGSDETNLMGKLTLAMAALEKGHAISLSSELGQRQKAVQHYSNAKENLEKLQEQLVASGYEDTEKIPEHISASLALLASADNARDNALNLYLTGELEKARAELRLAIKVHRSVPAAIESMAIGIHAGLTTEELLKEWDEYRLADIFSADEVSAAVVRAQVFCLAASRALAINEQTDSKQLLGELSLSLVSLKKMVNDDDLEKDLRNALKANLALIQAYRWALSQNAGTNSDVLNAEDIKAAYRHARDAEFYFQNKLGAEELGLSSLGELMARDSLVASRLAAGHLAAMHLEDWRDESKIFLAAAVQQASKLPRVDPVLPMLGEPLLKQFYSDVKNGDQKLAAEERQRRQMVTRCIEALFAIRFGSPAAGAKQLTKAVELGEASVDLTKVVDVAELSASADGFDAKVTLPDTIRAFEILGLIEAGESASAFEKAVRLTGGEKVTAADLTKMSDDAARSCLQGIESPLVAFTFGAAVEASLSDTDVSASLEFKDWLSKQGQAAFHKGQDLLSAERLVQRYPHLQDLVQNKIMEFKSPDLFVSRAEEFLLRGRLEEAKEVVQEGLAKHVKSAALWRLYFDCKISMVYQAGSDVSDELKTLMVEIENAEREALLTSYQGKTLSGKVLDLLGDYRKAEVAYRNASVVAESEKERISAASNAERLRILVASLAG
jgi:hypothetical protein